MKTLAVIAVTVAALLGLVAASPAGSAGDALPDLVPIRSYLKDRRVTFEAGHKLLRFSNGVGNYGPGALEVRGTRATTNDPMTAIQRVYQMGGGFVDVEVGTFSFEIPHNHWHFDDYVLYELLRPDGTVAATNDKSGFCLLDIARVRPGLPGSPRDPVYLTCNQGEFDALNIGPEGISRGWTDVYDWTLEGQSLDVTGLPGGIYYLRSTVDPLDLIDETDEGNNAATVAVRLR